MGLRPPLLGATRQTCCNTRGLVLQQVCPSRTRTTPCTSNGLPGRSPLSHWVSVPPEVSERLLLAARSSCPGVDSIRAFRVPLGWSKVIVVNWGVTMDRFGRRGLVFVSLLMAALVWHPVDSAAAYREASITHFEVSTRTTKPPVRPLQKKLSEPIRYAYSPCDGFTKSCDVWHVVTTTGKEWAVRDALPDEDMGDIAVSPDGVLLAYLHAKSERLMIRDLERGTVRIVPTPKSWKGWEMSFGFSRNSRWLAVDSIDHPKSRAIRYDVKTAKVLTLPRACCVIGIADAGTTFVAVHKDSAKTTEASAVRPGRTVKVQFPILPYLMLSKTHVSPD